MTMGNRTGAVMAMLVSPAAGTVRGPADAPAGRLMGGRLDATLMQEGVSIRHICETVHLAADDGSHDRRRRERTERHHGDALLSNRLVVGGSSLPRSVKTSAR